MFASRKVRTLAKVAAALAVVAVTGAVLSAATDSPNRDSEATLNGGELLPPEAFDDIADPAERSAAIFTEATKVFLHPRCSNCHPSEGDRPRQGDDGKLHEPHVRRGEDGFGVPALQCATCHTSVNFNPAGIPGAENWHLAPPEMGWRGKSISDLCEQLKDPKSNGERTLEELVDHVDHDPLVTWAWNPGAKRQPVPGTQDIFVALIAAWVEDGAVCPTP
ncbi:MAG: Isoquinoline 1-oxidoreductase subunit [Myxococcota bacterium]